MIRDVDESGMYHTWKMEKNITNFEAYSHEIISSFMLLPPPLIQIIFEAPWPHIIPYVWDQVSYPYKTAPVCCSFESS